MQNGRPEIFSKYIGETERIIRQIFRAARRIAPCVLVMDDLEFIGGRREPNAAGDEQQTLHDRVLTTILNEMDGIDTVNGDDEADQQVFVLGCCIDLSNIDEALARPGRLGKQIYVGLPSDADRYEIVRVCLKKYCSHELQQEFMIKQPELVRYIVGITKGRTGADIELLFKYVLPLELWQFNY